MIFEDVRQERWKWVRLIFAVFLTMSITLGLGAVASILINPPLPTLEAAKPHTELPSEVQKRLLTTVDNRSTLPEQPRNTPHRTIIKQTASGTPFITTDHPLTTAFIVQDSPDSVQSFTEHTQLIDAVFPDWFTVTTSSCTFNQVIDQKIAARARDNHILVLPRISNGDATGWHAAEFEQLLSEPETVTCLIHNLLSTISTQNADGINLDIEELAPSAREPFLDFVKEVSDVFHAAHKIVTIDIPVNDPAFDREYLGSITDAVVVMAYDEHYAGGEPGPIASEDWYEDVLEQSLLEIPREKIIIGIGNYGYDWTIATSTPATGLSFSATMALANEYGSEPEMNTSSRNMAFAYIDDSGHEHAVWFLNGLTAWNETVLARKRQVAGTALWRLGTEDPLFWRFNRLPTVSPTTTFSSSSPLHTITFTSEGELFRLHAPASAGSLDLTVDEEGRVDYARYTALPTGFVLERAGQAIRDKQLILTFDDGPDPVWTPQIMNLLTALKVPATFFVVGSQAEQYPALLKELRRRGFLIGNHTYTHPDISKISPERLRLELNQTQRVIEAHFGAKTILFRPPYDTDSAPSTLAQVRPIATLSQLGYIVVGANIDSSDWEKPGVEQIVANVKRGLNDPNNHVIVMHDAGGDRSQTIRALEQLIPELRREGYQFTNLDTALSVSSTLLNPSLDTSEVGLVWSTKIITTLRNDGWLVVRTIFFATTIISLIRLLFLAWFALRSRRHTVALPNTTNDTHLVSVLIPAFNEEKTVLKTLETLGQSTYPRLDIIVIDDGSTDRTAELVQTYARTAKNVRLIKKPNGGKSSALNAGIAAATGDIVVIIDADTIVYKETITNLAKAFSVPGVDAACGNVEVGNVHNILTSFQALEYIVTQNFDRRAFDELNCISVVPGATGAWRREKLLELGGFSDDTLTEDADITIRLLKSGGKIVYVTEARSKTEAPETVKALAKQRFRWSYGTFQCFFKHRDALFNGTLGWVALPNMLFFQVLFPIVSPLGDIIFLLSIWRGDVQAIAVGYLLFLSMDIFSALLGFALEKKGDKRLLALTLIQRFFYRQFMYVITYRTIVAVLKGRRHGWNKLARSGTVGTVPKNTHLPTP